MKECLSLEKKILIVTPFTFSMIICSGERDKMAQTVVNIQLCC